jgi:acyl dehydratase
MSIKPGKHLEDFQVGETYNTASRTVTEADIASFANLSGDFASIHTDEEFSKKNSIFKGRVAHGLLTLSMASGLFVHSIIFEETVMACLGMRNLRFVKPVRAGDSIAVELQVVNKKKTSKPEKGIVTFRESVKNQIGEVVIEGEFDMMMTPHQSVPT